MEERLDGTHVPAGTDKETIGDGDLKLKLNREGTPPEGTDKKPEVPTYDGDIDRYKGKTAEEIVKMHQEAEGLIGKHAETIGKLKGDLAFKERMAEFATPTPSKAEEIESEPFADRDKDEYIKIGEVQTYIDDAMTKERTGKETSDKERRLSMASAAHNEGKAKYLHGELSEGIEKEVEKVVHDYFRPYVEDGYDVSQYLRSSDVWDQAARYVRFNRGEYDRLQPAEGRDESRGPTPYTGERPTGRPSSTSKPYEEPVELDAKGRFIMRKFGLTEEEALEGIRDERRRRREAL